MEIWINVSVNDVSGAGGRATAAQRQWQPQQVGSGLALRRGQNGRLALERLHGPLAETAPFEPAEFARILAVDERHAALLCGSATTLRLNGSAPLPVAVLEDHDEITLLGGRLLFAAFTDAGPSAMAAADYRCARCKSVIKLGAVVHACPACGAVYHSDESDESDEGLAELAGSIEFSPPCYDYEPKCRSCLRSWASMHWNPEDGDARS